MIIVARAINGISLNGKEYLLDDENKEMQFKNRKAAKKFLRENGHEDWTDEELEDNYFFEEV